jgi:DNA-binding MarR family transcriptional regulator
MVRVMRLAAQKTRATAGIGPAQLFMLQQFGDGNALSLSELATRTLTDRSSVAEVVERLEEQGLVRREADPADKRRAAVRISAAGRRLLARSPKAPGTVLIGAIRKLTPRARMALAKTIGQLNVALGAAHGSASLLFVGDGVAAKNPSRKRR